MATFVDSTRIMKASRVALSDEVKNRLDVDEGDTVFSLYEKENKNLDSHQKTLIKALKSSMNTVFEVKNVLKNAFELYNLVNEKDYTVIPLVKMSHLRGIYKGTYLLARIFCFENEYFLLEITETMSSLKKDEMLKLAVAKIIEEPERVYADNKAKMKDIEIVELIFNYNSIIFNFIITNFLTS